MRGNAAARTDGTWHLRRGRVDQAPAEVRQTVEDFRAAVTADRGGVDNLTTIEQEMLMKALKRGYRVSEVASHEYARRWGTSKVVVWKLWFAYVWSFLKNLV